MKKSVKVTGELRISEKSEGYGSIMVEQEIIKLENGFANKSRRVAFINGKLEDLAELPAGTLLGGKIVRKESFSAMYDGHQPKINPSTGEIVLVNGNPVYFKDTYTDNALAQDELIVASSVRVSEDLKA